MNKKYLFLVLVLFCSVGVASATDYYVDPAGSGTTCSDVSSCTLATGLGKSLIGDDSLILKNGTYAGSECYSDGVSEETAEYSKVEFMWWD